MLFKTVWPMLCSKKVLVVAGATLTTCPLSLLSYYGNLLPYLASYFYAKRGPMTYHVITLWPSAVYSLCMPVAMMFTSPMERRLGIRKCIICTQIAIAICILSGFFTIEEPLALTFVFGALQGSFAGASHCLIRKFLLMSVADQGGLATGIMSVGPAFGAFVNICVTHYVINPKNVEADLLAEGTLYFSDPDILNRVPHYFLASGIFTAVLTTPGIILLLMGSADESYDCTLRSHTSDKETAVGDVNDKKSLKHLGQKNNLTNQHKPTYGGCDSNLNGAQEVSAFATERGFSNTNKTDTGTLKLHENLKNPSQESQSFGKSANSGKKLDHVASINSLLPLLDLVGKAVDENECYFGTEKPNSFQDDQVDELNISMRHHNENFDENIQNSDYRCHTDNECAYENTSNIYQGGVHVEHEISGQNTISIFTSTCDLSPRETVRTRRFWCIWICNLCLSHTYYIQTNLYKQYGQQVISSDTTLMLTGLLSAVLMTVARPFIGTLSDRYSARTALVVVSFFSSLFMNLIVVCVHTSAVAYVVACIIDFASTSCLVTVMDLLIASEFGRTHYASNMALLNTAAIPVLMKPIMVSCISRHFGSDGVFFSGSISSAVALLVAVLM